MEGLSKSTQLGVDLTERRICRFSFTAAGQSGCCKYVEYTTLKASSFSSLFLRAPSRAWGRNDVSPPPGLVLHQRLHLPPCQSEFLQFHLDSLYPRSLGLPRFAFPGGVHLKVATFAAFVEHELALLNLKIDACTSSLLVQVAVGDFVR